MCQLKSGRGGMCNILYKNINQNERVTSKMKQANLKHQTPEYSYMYRRQHHCAWLIATVEKCLIVKKNAIVKLKKKGFEFEKELKNSWRY